MILIFALSVWPKEMLADPIGRFGLAFITCGCLCGLIGGFISIAKDEHPMVGAFVGIIVGMFVGAIAGGIFARYG